MKKRFLRATIILLSMVLMVPSISPAWEMTDEFKKEIDEKLKAVEANPKDPHAHFDLAITYAYTNHVEEGWEELKTVDELDKEFAPVALDMYSKEVEAHPEDWRKRFRLAFALYFNDKKNEAIEEFHHIAEMEPKKDPKRVWAYGYIGLIYGEIDEIDKAVKYVKKAIKIDSNVAALHVLLASGYYNQGKGWEAFWEGMEALRLKALGY